MNWKAAIKRATGLDYRQAVARLAAQGHSKNGAAVLLGISPRTFYRHKLGEGIEWRAPAYTLEAIAGRLVGNQTQRERTHLERYYRARTREAQHTVRGVTGTLEQLAAHFAAASDTTVRRRLSSTTRQWTVEQAVTTPAETKYHPQRLGEHRLRSTL